MTDTKIVVYTNGEISIEKRFVPMVIWKREHGRRYLVAGSRNRSNGRFEGPFEILQEVTHIYHHTQKLHDVINQYHNR